LITRSDENYETSLDRAFRLYLTFFQIKVEYDQVMIGYKNYWLERDTSPTQDIFTERIIYWLFYESNINNFSSKLKSFIVARCDPFLPIEDCALLFYLSLQEGKIKETFKGFPLPTLYDIFTPLAEENLKKWKLAG
jgi:hypothetical protein